MFRLNPSTGVRTASLAVALLFGANTGLAAQAGARAPLDWERLAGAVVERMALESGERVMLLAAPGEFEELIVPLRHAVVRAGGVDLGVLTVVPLPVKDQWDPTLVARAAAESRESYREMFRSVDLAVMMPGPTTGHPAYLAMQDLLREGHGRTIHFHWQANGSVLPVPGQPVPSLHAVDRLYDRTVVETDYRALASILQRFETALRQGETHVTTPDGTDLRFRIGDRPVNRQDGDVSARRAAQGLVLIDREIELPAGALRVAPLEETVNGVVVFPISQWNGRPVRDLRLEFQAGVVTGVRAAEGLEHAEAEMQAGGDAGRSFREFALGFNPLLAVPDLQPWIPYYGYGAGVVRLSLGDNSELGGRVTGGYVRWNFFVNATVTVNGEVWVRDGRLVER